MAAKKIICPALCGVLSNGDEYGLIEFTQDVLLRVPEAPGTALVSCEMTMRFLEQTVGLRGHEQVGKAIVLKKEELDELCRRASHAAQVVPNPQPTDTYAFAQCQRALLLATDVPDEELPALRSALPKPKKPAAKKEPKR